MKRPPSLPRLLPGSPPATTLLPTASHVPSPHPPDHPSAPKEEFLSWKYRNGGQREPMRHETKKYSASDWRGECGEGQDGSKAFEKRAHGYRRRRGEASEPRSSPTRYPCALKAPVSGAGVMSGSHLWFWLRRALVALGAHRRGMLSCLPSRVQVPPCAPKEARGDVGATHARCQRNGVFKSVSLDCKPSRRSSRWSPVTAFTGTAAGTGHGLGFGPLDSSTGADTVPPASTASG